MRWGRKKQPDPPPASPRPSLLSSWLLRFKKMGISTARDRVERKPTGKLTPCSFHADRISSSRGPGVYRRDEAFWSLSFRKEKVDGGIQELLGNPVEELGDAQNFDQMVSGIRRVERKGRSLTGLKTPWRGKFTRNRGKVGVENSGSSSIGSQDYSFSATESEEIDELPSELIAEMGSEDLKSGSRRKSLSVRSRGSPKRRPRSSCRVRIHSPRATPRAKPKSKKKSKEKGGNGLERFAVTKCSFNPQRDFRDSMVEMILDRRIRKPDDLEELLACYLALNSDEYHDVIIEVFRQLWFELNQASCCEYDPAELTTEEEMY